MRILHVYKDYYPVLGGIENHLHEVARAQAARGHDVTVLVTNPDGHKTRVSEEEGVRVVRSARIATIASTPISISLPWQLLRQKPDIVHMHFPYPLGESSQWLMRRGRASVITYHSDVIRQAGMLRVYGPLLRRVLRQVDRILPTSPNYIESSPYLRPLADRCTVVPLSVDIDRFATPRSEEVSSIRARFPGPLLLFVGRLRYYKGLKYLIDAMKDIPASLLIIGDGPERDVLVQQAASSSASAKISFLGDMGDAVLPSFFQAADIFVLPSSQRSEAFGIVLLEAMAAGTPLISTELQTGTSWVNQQGKTGLVVAPRDPKALAGAANELLADDELRAKMGQQAQKRAKEEFNLPILVDRIEEVYYQLLLPS